MQTTEKVTAWLRRWLVVRAPQQTMAEVKRGAWTSCDRGYRFTYDAKPQQLRLVTNRSDRGSTAP